MGFDELFDTSEDNKSRSSTSYNNQNNKKNQRGVHDSLD